MLGAELSCLLQEQCQVLFADVVLVVDAHAQVSLRVVLLGAEGHCLLPAGCCRREYRLSGCLHLRSCYGRCWSLFVRFCVVLGLVSFPVDIGTYSEGLSRNTYCIRIGFLVGFIIEIGVDEPLGN